MGLGKRLKLRAANRGFPNPHAGTLGSRWLTGVASSKSMRA